jgi:hypothetical protein
MNHHDYTSLLSDKKEKKLLVFLLVIRFSFTDYKKRKVLHFRHFKMDPNNKDEILSNFVAITQTSHEEATRYLEAAQWNAETAMEIFFDNGGSQAGEPIPTTNIVPPATNVNQGAPGLY